MLFERVTFEVHVGPEKGDSGLTDDEVDELADRFNDDERVEAARDALAEALSNYGKVKVTTG
jgi:hypothetical protein